MSEPSNVSQTLGELRAIPRERLGQKIKRTILGAGFVTLSVVGATKWGWPWYVMLPPAVAGAHIISAELTRSAARFVVSLVKDLLAAIRNGRDGNGQGGAK